MSVLSELSQRLKTDLADTARASIDPIFSRKLDEANFRDKAFQQERKAALEDQARIRQQQLADRADAEQLASQKFAVGKLFDIAMNDKSGDGWTKYMELNTGGRLRPDVQQLSDLLADGQGGVSLDARKFDYEQDKDFKAQTFKEQEFALKKREYVTDRDQKNAEIVLKRKKLDLERMAEFRVRTDAVKNRQSMIDFVRDTPDIQTPRERESFTLRLKKAAPDEIITVWDEIMDRAASRLDNAERAHRARVTARGLMGPITTDASKIELSIAKQALRQHLGSEFDDAFFDKGERDLMVEALGSKINFYSRNMRKDQTDPAVIDKALSEVLPNYELGSFFGLDDPSFKLPENTTITTQEEYDALPPGTKYINAEDGQTYEKP